MKMTKLEKKDVESNHSRFEQVTSGYKGVELLDDIDAVVDDALDSGGRDLVHDQVPILVGEIVRRVSCCQHRVTNVSYVYIYIHTNIECFKVSKFSVYLLLCSIIVFCFGVW